VQILEPGRKRNQTTGPWFNDSVTLVVDENETPSRKINIVRVEV
jgi:hypothetical protein